MQEDNFQDIAGDQTNIELEILKEHNQRITQELQALRFQYAQALETLSEVTRTRQQARVEIQFLVATIRDALSHPQTKEEEFDQLADTQFNESPFIDIMHASNQIGGEFFYKCKLKYSDMIQLLVDQVKELESKDYIIDNLQNDLNNFMKNSKLKSVGFNPQVKCNEEIQRLQQTIRELHLVVQSFQAQIAKIKQQNQHTHQKNLQLENELIQLRSNQKYYLNIQTELEELRGNHKRWIGLETQLMELRTSHQHCFIIDRQLKQLRITYQRQLDKMTVLQKEAAIFRKVYQQQSKMSRTLRIQMDKLRQVHQRQLIKLKTDYLQKKKHYEEEIQLSRAQIQETQNTMNSLKEQLSQLNTNIYGYQKTIIHQETNISSLCAQNANLCKALQIITKEKNTLEKSNEKMNFKIAQINQRSLEPDASTILRKSSTSTMTTVSDSDSVSSRKSKGGKSYLIRSTIDEYVKELAENLGNMGGMTNLEIKTIIEGELNSISVFAQDLSQGLKI